MTTTPAVIPAPQALQLTGGGTAVDPRTLAALAAALDTHAPHAARALRDTAARVAAPTPPPPSPAPASAALDASLPPEGYTLAVSDAGWHLRAGDPAGAFYAVQTLTQLLAEAAPDADGVVTVPALTCSDAPAYPLRGLSFDLARHFFGVRDIERLLDLAASYRLNQLHLHLSDDQGWRLEIDDRPLLVKLASANDVDGGPGGYLSLADYHHLQDYAESRHVTIVPEIDLPGHTHAAQVAYPEISPDGRPREPYAGIEVGFSAVHLTSPETWSFVEDVVASLARHTRGPRLHLGGDEVHTLGPAEYRAFLERLGGVVAEYGKQLIMWQEAAPAALPPGTLLQFWTSDIDTDHLATVARERDVRFVASPAVHAYLDLKHDPAQELGLTWAGTVEVRDAYEWDPVAALPGIPAAAIEGVEACLWTETLRTWDDVTTMLLPRLPAVASVAWGSPRDTAAFLASLAAHGERWARDGVAFHRSPQVPWRG